MIYGTKHFVEWTLIKSTEKLEYFRTHDADFLLPEKVIEGENVCYFDNDKNSYVYVKMLSNDTVAPVGGTGACPSSFPEDTVEIFER